MTSTLSILDPNDNLMKKFQRTLHVHLLHVDNKLSEEILDLEASIKHAEKELESEAIQLYQKQEEVQHQHIILKQYIEALSKVTLLREKRNNSIENAKDILKENYSKLKGEKDKKEKLCQKLKNLLEFYSYLSKWEKDLNDHLIISKQVSLQDVSKNKILIKRKQQRDFILYRLKEEIWKIESEIAYIDEQLQIKDKEKQDANRMIIDANTDLETLHMEHKDLYNIWKSVVTNISKRNSIHDQLNFEQKEAHQLYNGLLLEIQKIRKETEKEMENNEHLTSLSFRIENDIKITSRAISKYNENIANSKSELLNLTKISEQTEYDYNVIFNKYQNYLYEEEQVNKRFENIFEKRNNLEDAIFKKLEEKVICNKATQYVNELLINTKNAVLQSEISVARVENTYGNNLLQLEKLKNLIENKKAELHELSQINTGKEKQIDELQKETRKYEVMMGKAQTKLLGINKLLEQILPSTNAEELSPLDIKIVGLEKNIQEFQLNIKKTQQFWLRQQGFVVSLSQQRELQLQEINFLQKEVMIMGQKNFKLEYALEMLTKEQANVNKAVISLDQKLSRINSNLMVQKDLKKGLEDKNCIIKNECLLSFQELELELIKLQSDLKYVCTEKVMLKEELNSVLQESLAWNKKVQLIQDTIKNVKEEQNTGSIASMKSEIHRMEMRLSYLKKIQEKLIHDMNLCITRRDIIVDKVFGRLKRNSKVKHNEKVVMHKRLSDQRAKIKQLLKIKKQTVNMIEKLNNQVTSIQDKLVKCQEFLRNLKEHVNTVENEIERLELLKYHNLHSLVLKQRKVKQLYDIKNGIYKMIYKNENIIEENLQKEHYCREYLKCTLERTDHDFPMLKNRIKKVLVTLQII
ncbi:lethal (2) 41Ab isoform X1 [Bombus vancouverensis nearcticus]|uniref:Coiled-coil domain-containing protein 40 isoform X1 n=1 Tax=Bombus bifarius TaxID=103933 RepID=A0A6P8NCI7_9HYME|nr:coiled-coil domain-containing protein 40 isoform X1 [Bombus vancouverensis nearcticus]XP_033312307.1 coiled-coil domain-containing protein 40 isoform X1 [Bombus bifarius]